MENELEVKDCNLDDDFKPAEGFVPTRRDLEMLAHQYLDDVANFKLLLMTHGTICSDCSKERDFAFRRLDSIERSLGKDVYGEVRALVMTEWATTINDLYADLATPTNCEECGEEFLRKFLDQIICDDCDGEMCICNECLDSLASDEHDQAPALP